MSRISSMAKLSRQITGLNIQRASFQSFHLSTMLQAPIHNQSKDNLVSSPTSQVQIKDDETVPRRRRIAGENISRKDKVSFLVTTLMDLPNSKEAVYTTLDAWVAWERDFPIGPLKRALQLLEKEQQWHRIVQVIKWLLSKGQGTTRGTYGQLIRALEKDHRVEEANEIWKKKLAYDLHSVPWSLCDLMISVYYRNEMFGDLVKLFKGLESFDRKPPEKEIVQKVANAYELLGLADEKERVLEKYKDLFDEGKLKKSSRRRSPKKGDRWGNVGPAG